MKMLRWFSLKKFLLMMGISAGAFAISVFLHNALYGLIFVKIFTRPDLDEPVFFFIAVFLCPAAFLVGAAGSMFLTIKRLWVAKKPPSGSQ